MCTETYRCYQIRDTRFKIIDGITIPYYIQTVSTYPHLSIDRLFSVTTLSFTLFSNSLPQMCWSKDVSYATFATGTFLNLAFGLLFCTYGRYDLAVLLLLWEYALLMQLPEAAAWEELEQQQRSSYLTTLTAFILNVTQPLAAWAGVACVTGSWALTPAAWVAALVYVACLVQDRAHIRRAFRRGIQPEQQCDHLQLDWWTPASGWLYNLVMVVLFLHLPPALFWVTLLVFEGSLLLAYRWKTCGRASLWCLSIACVSVVYGGGWGMGVL